MLPRADAPPRAPLRHGSRADLGGGVGTMKKRAAMLRPLLFGVALLALLNLAPDATPSAAAPVILVGEQTLGSMMDYSPAGWAEAFPYAAVATGTTATLYL